ncbi:MAG: trypsin-like serine peptidase [Pseudomonadota bacterium]
MRARLAMALICLPFMAMAQQAAPGDTALRELATADQSRGWEAVGRIDLGNSAFCTGALIAPNLVLTAAHCLVQKDSGAPFPTEKIRFLAGWRNGRAVAYRGVRRAISHPSYVYDGPNKMDRVAYDVALLELDQPIRLPSVRPFATAANPRQGDRIEVVSYALDRSEAPSIQESCEVLGREPRVLVLSCLVDFGASGAPVFSMSGGEPRIVSVISAKAEMDARVVALASAAADPIADLRAALAAQGDSAAQPVPGIKRVIVGGASSGTGAKFLRP